MERDSRWQMRLMSRYRYLACGVDFSDGVSGLAFTSIVRGKV